MTFPILDWGIFGVDMNVWADAMLRLQLVVVVMTVTVMALIYIERKFVGRIQMRLGPMRTGPYGTLQSIADALKLLTKEDVWPSTADFWLFQLAPFVTFVPVFMMLLALPFMEGWGVRDLQLGLFYIVAVSGVTVIGYIMAGWASDNKYALLGAVRSAAQLISYEIPLILAVLAVSMVAGSLNLNDITMQQDMVPNLLLQPLPFLIFLTATLAELSRRPFDIPIGESELVGGPWVEYSGIRWSIIFALTEYAGMWGLSILAALVFLGGWQWPFGTESWWGDFDFVYQLMLIGAKSFFLILVMMWISASFPRLRIDQLMAFCWKILLPFGFLQVIANGIVLMYLDDETVRDIALFLTSSALLVAMSYVIYMATRQPSREERVGTILAARSAQ
ncbi:MAG TPA: NADH-quinone oxidoreductase subunit NuoH [Dehalococcoidia bacterium]|nr:NADH-quinone oxidoreductase subunit NuoH [Dehalococcoidia bacterium]